MTAYVLRELYDDDAEIDWVTRACMRTVLETIPEMNGSEATARETLSNFSFEQMRAMIADDLDKSTHLLLVVADADDQPVAHAMVSQKMTPKKTKFGLFFNSYVLPEHRRKGVATMLMDGIVEWFDDYRWAFLLAHTHQRNAGAQRLLSTYGFQVTEEHDTPWPHYTMRCDRKGLRRRSEGT